MGKHVVFLLHGMGSHKKGWSKPAIKALKANATALGYPLKLTTDFEFIEINYDHNFLDYLEQHNKEANTLSTYMTMHQLGKPDTIFRGLWEYASGSLSNEKFVIAALGDVYLYKLTNYQDKVRNFVLTTITRTLEAKGKPEWSVLAHSLGTRVIHDVLDEFVATWSNLNDFGKPMALGMISNVTHLLALDPSTLWKETRVWPHSTIKQGPCYKYVSALHPADPFTWIKEFDPTPDWGNNAEYSGLYRKPSIGIKELTRANSHSFEGYLEHPKVAADILWAFGTGTTDAPAFDPDKLDTSMSKYASKTLGGASDKVWKKAENLKQERDLTSKREFVRAINDFEKFIKKFGESLKS